MGYLSNAVWANYGNIIRQFHDDANQESVTWKRSRGALDRYGEDNSAERYTDITIKVLFDFNIFRTWPLNKATDTGNIDKQSAMMIINRKYLSELGYTDANGDFDFDPDTDIFIHRGDTYMSEGDTFASQAKDALGAGDPLHIYIILKRQQPATG